MGTSEHAFLVYADGLLIGSSDLEQCEHDEDVLACILEGVFEPTEQYELVRAVFERYALARADAAPSRAAAERFRRERDDLRLAVAPQEAGAVEDVVVFFRAREPGSATITIEVAYHGDRKCDAWEAARLGNWLPHSPAWGLAQSHDATHLSARADRLSSLGVLEGEPPRRAAVAAPPPAAEVRARRATPMLPLQPPAAPPAPYGDFFVRMPYLAPPDTWHPEASRWIEEASDLGPLVGGSDHGFEVWAVLGALTHADPQVRIRSMVALRELLDEESQPAWPTVARCLLRLASSALPGRACAAYRLLALVTRARKHDRHRELLGAEELTRALLAWTDEPRRSLAAALRARMEGAGRLTHAELFQDEDLADAVERAERSADPS